MILTKVVSLAYTKAFSPIYYANLFSENDTLDRK